MIPLSGAFLEPVLHFDPAAFTTSLKKVLDSELEFGGQFCGTWGTKPNCFDFAVKLKEIVSMQVFHIMMDSGRGEIRWIVWFDWEVKLTVISVTVI